MFLHERQGYVNYESGVRHFQPIADLEPVDANGDVTPMQAIRCLPFALACPDCGAGVFTCVPTGQKLLVLTSRGAPPTLHRWPFIFDLLLSRTPHLRTPNL